MTERLTTLAAVKDWLGIDSTDSDTMLIRVIDAASQFVLNYVNQDSFAARTFTQNFRGNGKSTVLLRNWPVISVSSVGIGGRSIVASVAGNAGLPGSGYMISDFRNAPQSLELYGYGFWYGAPSQVVYRAGFETTQSFVLVSGQSMTTNKAGQWIQDNGVTKNGTAMVKVDSNPATDQYAVDAWGTYTFAAADAGSTVVISFGYAPWDVAFAVTEMVGEWFKRKDRIGLLSKTLGGQETVTFSNMDLSPMVVSSLQPYINVVPI